MVFEETWAKSTNMPNRFISLTIISPKSDKPLLVIGMLPSSLSDESALEIKLHLILTKKLLICIISTSIVILIAQQYAIELMRNAMPMH